jgi:hypothetical protein
MVTLKTALVIWILLILNDYFYLKLYLRDSMGFFLNPFSNYATPGWFANLPLLGRLAVLFAISLAVAIALPYVKRLFF